jgi:hypothetical protein
MASTLVVVGLILLTILAGVFAFSGLSGGISYIGDKISSVLPSSSSSSTTYPQEPAMFTGGARKLFRGKKMSRGQSTGAFLVVVSALIYSLYRSAQHFLLLTGR